MPYGKQLKKMFKEITPTVEDIYLLEPFQIDTFKNMAPQKEFAALLSAYPTIKTFLLNKHPPIAQYIHETQEKYDPIENIQKRTEAIDYFLWEIAHLIIYNKYPDIYDKQATFGWDYTDITSVVPLTHKIVLDAGAGTGRIAFNAVKDADIVFAIEPCANLRKYIRTKAHKKKISNLYVIDGFLHQIPLPTNYADVLITSNAIGWTLEDELTEIQRIIKPGGYIIHLLSSDNKEDLDPFHHQLTNPPWNYTYSEYTKNKRFIRKYWKHLPEKK